MSSWLPQRRALAIWLSVSLVVLMPLGVAGFSPLLAWRQPVYIAAGFAGVLAFGLLFVQPLLAINYLPGLTASRSRRWHRVVGAALLGAVIVHVVGLWITSPPDVIDALLLRSPTPFSIWGVISLWATVATALMVMLRRRLPLRVPAWRSLHRVLTGVVVASTIVHAWLIQGTMVTATKFGLSVFVALAFAFALYRRLRPRARSA